MDVFYQHYYRMGYIANRDNLPYQTPSINTWKKAFLDGWCDYTQGIRDEEIESE